MTSKRQRQAGYLLPDPQTGYPLVCVQLMIPDHPRYRAALRGQLKALGDWWTWEKSYQPGDRRATIAAQLWRELLHQYLTIGECGAGTMFDVRQNEEAPCTLEKTTDGETWEPWADLQLCPPKIRSIAGRLFLSTDGGSTWTPVEDATYEEYDWRQDEPLKPPRTGDDKRCLAAANAVAVFVELHRQIVAWYESAQGGLALGMAILGVLALLFPAGAFYIAGAIGGTGLALAILEHATALTNASFTSEIQDELRCIFFCAANDDGRWSEMAFNFVMADVQAKSGDMWRLLELYLGEIGGYVGLNNAGTTTSVTSATCDCTECGWCYVFDFTQSSGGWVSGGATLGTYVPGQGWRAVVSQPGGGPYPQLLIRRNFASTTITYIAAHIVGSAVGNTQGYYAVRRAGDIAVAELGPGLNPRAGQAVWLSASGSWPAQAQIGLYCGEYYTSSNDLWCDRIVVRGTGANPFGEDNCT
jgi:hypothetical protein